VDEVRCGYLNKTTGEVKKGTKKLLKEKELLNLQKGVRWWGSNGLCVGKKIFRFGTVEEYKSCSWRFLEKKKPSRVGGGGRLGAVFIELGKEGRRKTWRSMGGGYEQWGGAARFLQ